MRYAHRFAFPSFAGLCAAAACLWLFAAVAAAQITPAERVFSGKLGNKYRIQMRLRRDGKTLSGSYFYERVQKNLKLSGEIGGHNDFSLREYDDGGVQTGISKENGGRLTVKVVVNYSPANGLGRTAQDL